MLIKREYTNRFKQDVCKYQCDRCNADITIKERYQISITKPNTNASRRIKYADLCPRCMRALDRGIRKGINKNEQ